MEDSNMEEVEEEHQVNRSPSPPRKRIKTNGESSTSQVLVPSRLRLKIDAHEGGCNSISFLHSSHHLISGGKDSAIKLWDTTTGALHRALKGFQGGVCDLAISSDNSLLVAGLTSRKLCAWDLNSGQICQTLVGFQQKVCAVDISKFSSRYVASADHNGHCIKLWDLQKNDIKSGYFDSNCNALCFIKNDSALCSGHNNGKIIFFNNEMNYGRGIAVHSQPVTSICTIQNGNVVLTSGRDNWHNLVDLRSLQVSSRFRTKCNSVGTNFSRSCTSPDENFFVVGSADGSVYVWSMKMQRIAGILKEDNAAAVVSCSWGGMGSPLATAHIDGTICIWS